eukprot:c30501_g1_i1 orf=2-349(-)
MKIVASMWATQMSCACVCKCLSLTLPLCMLFYFKSPPPLFIFLFMHVPSSFSSIPLFGRSHPPMWTHALNRPRNDREAFKLWALAPRAPPPLNFTCEHPAGHVIIISTSSSSYGGI